MKAPAPRYLLAPYRYTLRMSDSAYTSISLGRWDPYRRTPSLLIGNGRLRFLPGPGIEGELAPQETLFAPGARLEYRVEKGDMYFDGDSSQSLERSLWVVSPDGSRNRLAHGLVLYMNLNVAARNLKSCGIPFAAVSFYRDKEGQVIEKEISIPKSLAQPVGGFFLALSNLWLGVLVGAFIPRLSYVIVLGIAGFAILSIVTMRSASSQRVAALNIVSSLVTWTAGYLIAIVLVRSVLNGFAR